MRDITRDGLVAAILGFLGRRDPEALEALRVSLHGAIEAAGPAPLRELGARLEAPCDDWEFHPRDPLARRLHHVIAGQLLEPSSSVDGLEHLATLDGRRLLITANHLSYSDANLLEILWHRFGAASLADRLTVMAGPKVYSSLARRFSSLCFGTIRTPQTSSVSSDEAVMSPRDVARAARRAIQAAHDRLGAGDALVVFAEGTRSRSGAMQQTLAGVTRYFEGADVLVLPVAITGTDALFPIGAETVHPVRINARVGPPIGARALHARAGGDRRLMMDVVGLAIADLLPAACRGVYSGDAPHLDAARRVRQAVGGVADPGRG